LSQTEASFGCMAVEREKTRTMVAKVRQVQLTVIHRLQRVDKMTSTPYHRPTEYGAAVNCQLGRQVEDLLAETIRAEFHHMEV
jgi:hypothetical protein